VTFVSPKFDGGDRTDDHPFGDPRAAQGFVRDVFAAFARSPQWQRGVFILTYDEWGGFFDHVPPAHFPDDRASTIDNDDFSQAGFRVPTFLCSPRALPGFVDHTKYEHTSILRFIEWRFLGAPAHGTGLPTDRWFLTKRDRHAANLGRNLSSAIFNPDAGFDLDLHVDPAEPPCASGEDLTATAAEPSMWEALVERGYFDRLGLPHR
jgi:phospholipase C